jgi:hypothetical protein
MDSPEKDSIPRGTKFWSMFGIVAVSAFAAVVGYGFALANFTNNAFDKSGQFGDSFAPLNTLFGGLAFAALWASLRMQRQELALQREELRLTRKELALSVEAQARLALAAEQDEAIRTRPRVVITMEYGDWDPSLVVRNDGASTARNVRLSSDKQIDIYPFAPGQQSAQLIDLPLFSGRGHTLVPETSISYILRPPAQMQWLDVSFDVTAEYTDSAGTQYREVFPLSTELVLGSRARPDSMKTVVSELKELNRRLEVIGDSLRK